MQDIMCDLETYGTEPGSVILSIGAVYFGPEGLGKEFYAPINLASSMDSGFTIDPDTLLWWNKQSPEARRIFDEVGPAAANVQSVLHDFEAFVDEGSGVRIWGNGASFDNAVLTAYYAKLQRKAPWNYYNDRCYRTLKNIAPGPKLARVGTFHNALDDAKSQALHAIELFKASPQLVWG